MEIERSCGYQDKIAEHELERELFEEAHATNANDTNVSRDSKAVSQSFSVYFSVWFLYHRLPDFHLFFASLRLTPFTYSPILPLPKLNFLQINHFHGQQRQHLIEESHASSNLDLA